MGIRPCEDTNNKHVCKRYGTRGKKKSLRIKNVTTDDETPAERPIDEKVNASIKYHLSH